MTSHLGIMILFAACVAVVFGTLQRDDPRSQLRLAARIGGGLVIGAYLTGWLLYLLFR